MHAAVEFCDATGRHASSRAHLCDQKAAVFNRQKVVRHARFHGFGRKHKPRFLRIGYVEEENSVLPFQQAEQPPATQDGLVRIQVAVVRFVAGVAGRRDRYDIDHFSIFGRLFVKIDHGKEIRSNVRLVLRPDIQNLFSSSMVIRVPLFVLCPGHGACAEQQRGYKEQTRGRPGNSVRFRHVIILPQKDRRLLGPRVEMEYPGAYHEPLIPLVNCGAVESKLLYERKGQVLIRLRRDLKSSQVTTLSKPRGSRALAKTTSVLPIEKKGAIMRGRR